MREASLFLPIPKRPDEFSGAQLRIVVRSLHSRSGMTKETQLRSRSTPARVLCLMHHPPCGGRRECQVPAAPAAPRAKMKSTQISPPQVHRTSPAFPARVVLTGSFVLSPAIGLLVTVTGGSFHRRDASVEASGPHDFTVRGTHTRLVHRPRPSHLASNVW